MLKIYWKIENIILIIHLDINQYLYYYEENKINEIKYCWCKKCYSFFLSYNKIIQIFFTQTFKLYENCSKILCFT